MGLTRSGRHDMHDTRNGVFKGNEAGKGYEYISKHVKYTFADSAKAVRSYSYLKHLPKLMGTKFVWDLLF